MTYFPTDVCRVLVVGDTHADAGMVRWANEWASRLGVDAILQVGDFGWWPNRRFAEPFFVELDRAPVPWVFCDGNHEDHSALDHGATSPQELADGVFWVPRGVVVEWVGRRLLFFGGAVSVDAEWRTPFLDWFPTETAGSAQLTRAFDAGTVDVVVAHDCPAGAPLALEPRRFPERLVNAANAHRRVCRELAEAVAPKLWLAGHYHQRVTAQVGRTRVDVLSDNSGGHWAERAAVVVDLSVLDVSPLRPV